MGYIYQADVYCENCGESIRKQLRAEGKAPEDELDHYTYDSDDFPKDAQVEREESDSPQYCAKCGEFLHNPLTSEGYTRVQEQLNGWTAQTNCKSIYQGSCPIHLKVVASWYDFSYWTKQDCEDDRRHSEPGWYSPQAY